MPPVLLVFLGAGLGGALRHGINLAALAALGPRFPAGTLAVNLLGSGLMGLAVGWFALRGADGLGQDLRLFLTTGVLGGFTTFSAFSMETIMLWQRGEVALTGLYLVASVAGSLAALCAGLALVGRLS